MRNIRVILALAAEFNDDIKQLDVQIAHLQSPVEKNVHVKITPGYHLNGQVMKGKKPQSGLR